MFAVEITAVFFSFFFYRGSLYLHHNSSAWCKSSFLVEDYSFTPFVLHACHTAAFLLFSCSFLRGCISQHVAERAGTKRPWKVILILSSDGNRLNAIHYWALLKLKCSVCYQTQTSKGGARLLWCIPGLHIGRAFSSLIIKACIGESFKHSQASKHVELAF